ncbi:S24 family peptidase [Janthinobacterium agaricidamnosum]|nr:S24 family peptidase [Janthinobacterium agaricidamnosum]
MHSIRRHNLRKLIEDEENGNPAAFGRKYLFTESRLSQLLSETYRDGKNFGEKMARKIEQQCKLPLFFLDRIGPPGSPAGATGFEHLQVVVRDEGDPEFIKINKVRLRLSAGVTGFQTEPVSEHGGTLTVSREWVRQNGYAPERLIAIQVKGESMEPALYAGDMVVVNTADKTIVDGAVFALNYEGEAVVKRLSRDIGEWWLSSDNPDQRKYHRKLCRSGECIVVGRVVRKESDRI